MIPFLFAATVAAAATGSSWDGEWGIDPSRSDDPTTLIEGAYTGPSTTTGRAARPYSPDGGQVDVEAAKRKLLYRLISVLGRSGRLSLASEEASVRLGWGDGDPLELVPGRKWTRVKPEDGDKYKIRVQQIDERFVVERRIVGATITETLMSPDDQDEIVVVVGITGNELGSGLEFRRVYRRL